MTFLISYRKATCLTIHRKSTCHKQSSKSGMPDQSSDSDMLNWTRVGNRPTSSETDVPDRGLTCLVGDPSEDDMTAETHRIWTRLGRPNELKVLNAYLQIYLFEMPNFHIRPPIKHIGLQWVSDYNNISVSSFRTERKIYKMEKWICTMEK